MCCLAARSQDRQHQNLLVAPALFALSLSRGGSYVCLSSVCRLSAVVWGFQVDSSLLKFNTAYFVAEGIDEGRRLPLFRVHSALFRPFLGPCPPSALVCPRLPPSAVYPPSAYRLVCRKRPTHRQARDE
jgi:hypothetical protein